jgi:hypothetical protein
VPRLYGRVTSIVASAWPRTYLALASNLSGLGLECGVLEPIPAVQRLQLNTVLSVAVLRWSRGAVAPDYTPNFALFNYPT